MDRAKKILIITPRFPHPEAGADEQERAAGIRQLVRLGFSVRVIAKYFDWQNSEEIKVAWAREGVVVQLIPYKFQKKSGNKIERFILYLKTLDGSTIEYAESKMQMAVKRELRDNLPDLVWFDYTYLTPLYKLIKKFKLPIIVRSINFEPDHYWDENNQSVFKFVKYFPKLITEYKTSQLARLLFAISPNEETKYKKISDNKNFIFTLPLRSLTDKLATHTPHKSDVLHAFFAGSTFFVQHNLHALNFITEELAPMLLNKFGNKVKVHIFGSKIPIKVSEKKLANVVYEGFVPDLNKAINEMDIALAPSFFGAGMQQKVFEPLARGFPTITHARALAGYNFIPGEEVLLAASALEFCTTIERLFDFSFRAILSAAAIKKSRELFNKERLDALVLAGINSCLSI